MEGGVSTEAAQGTKDGTNTAGGDPTPGQQENVDDSSAAADAEPIPVSYQIPTKVELRLRAMDPLLQEWTPVDEVLQCIIGDTIHHNDNTHLAGGIEGYNDAK